MLLSLLLALTSTDPAPILGPLGRPARAWFLRQLTLCQPALAKSIHDQSGLKPYTISSLLDDRGYQLSKGKWLKRGKVCWLRLTTYQQELSEIVVEKVLPQLPSRLTLYKMNFRVDGYTLDPSQHPWASQSTFPQLAETIYLSRPTRKVRLEFTSPTAFRSDGNDIPLPIPEHIFRGYWQRWNAFAPATLHIDELWPRFASACVRVSELTAINTERWSFANGTQGAAVGFTGTAGFTLLPKKRCGELGPFWAEAAQVLNTLAAFSFYCGTGHHTTVGMGSTRKI